MCQLSNSVNLLQMLQVSVILMQCGVVVFVSRALHFVCVWRVQDAPFIIISMVKYKLYSQKHIFYHKPTCALAWSIVHSTTIE